MVSQGLAEGGVVYDPLFKPCWYTQGPFVRVTQGVRVDGISFTEFAGRSGDSPRYRQDRSGTAGRVPQQRGRRGWRQLRETVSPGHSLPAASKALPVCQIPNFPLRLSVKLAHYGTVV